MSHGDSGVDVGSRTTSAPIPWLVIDGTQSPGCLSRFRWADTAADTTAAGTTGYQHRWTQPTQQLEWTERPGSTRARSASHTSQSPGDIRRSRSHTGRDDNGERFGSVGRCRWRQQRGDHAPGTYNIQYVCHIRCCLAHSQLQALQASQARMSQHRAMAAQAIPSPSNGSNGPPPGASPVNGGPSIPTPPQQTAPSPAGPSITAPVLNGTGTGPSILQAQLAQQQERLRQAAQPPSAPTPISAQPATPHTPNTSTNPTAPPSARPGRPGVNPQQQQRQFAQSLANYFKTTSGTLPAEVFNGERDGAVKIAGKWFNLLDFFGHFAKHQVSMVS